jgi:hypothetical protein
LDRSPDGDGLPLALQGGFFPAGQFDLVIEWDNVGHGIPHGKIPLRGASER